MAVAAVAASLAGCVAGAPPASASSNQLAMFEVPNIATQNAAQTLEVLRSLGVDILRVPVPWSSVAPDPSSSARPNFNASDPGAYPAANWGPYDHLVRLAQADGIAVDLMPTGPAPLWATGSGGPACGPTGGTGPSFCYQGTFEPSAAAYGRFVHAVATRYRSVHFWEIWNEANWGPSLTPQYYRSSVPVSAKIYRGLLNAAWTALHQTGHGRDTIILSSLSQDGSAHPGETGTTAPLVFIRALYCVNPSFKQLFGAAARQAGCPTSKAAYRRFRAANPALFNASGMGDHPYPYGKPPTKLDFPNPDGAEFAELPHMISTLDRVQHAYGSRKRMAVYNTEFGYQLAYTSPQNVARYLNWAEYLSWKNPRIGSYDQYELQDGGWFKTGLLYANGSPKPSFYAYRLPVWLPSTATRRGRTLEVWGDARPAHFATADGHGAQYVYIQFSRGGKSAWANVRRVRITNPRGYFDVRVRFPSSGSVRLAWRYPPGDSRLTDPIDPSSWIYSRVTAIRVS